MSRAIKQSVWIATVLLVIASVDVGLGLYGPKWWQLGIASSSALIVSLLLFPYSTAKGKEE